MERKSSGIAFFYTVILTLMPLCFYAVFFSYARRLQLARVALQQIIDGEALVPRLTSVLAPRRPCPPRPRQCAIMQMATSQGWKLLMKKRPVGIRVSLFLLAGLLALLFIAVYVSGRSTSPSAETFRLCANFDGVAGLTINAKVSMAGVVVGQVSAIDLDHNSFSARVTMQMSKGMEALPMDSTASVLTSGLVGKKYFGISMGK